MRRFHFAILMAGLIFGQTYLGQAEINVADYGAKGDLLTLSNVKVVNNSKSIVCPGASFTSADVNKLLEVFNGGIWRGISNETLVAYIQTVSSPSNITVSVAAGTTANGLTGVYGTDNTPCFTNAVAHCAVPKDTVVIPAGNYLLIPRSIVTGDWSNWYVDAAAISLSRGGITFIGQGNVVLWGNGGWKLDGQLKVQRDHLVNFISPMTNLFPVVFSNLTFYGGINGKTDTGNLSPQTGEGWDITHHAIFFGQHDSTTIFPTNVVLLDCTFHGYRGEMIIHNLPNSTTFLTASNCVFYDGNATAFNVYFTHDYNFCTFSNVQCEEFYQMNSMVGSSVVRNCTFFNSGIAVNGGVYWCPTYNIVSNTFASDNSDANFIATTPACNLNVSGNNFIGGQGISLGILGYQGAPYYCCNSNLVFSANHFTKCYMAFHFQGYDDVGYSNSVRSVTVVSNVFDACYYDAYANGSPGYIPSWSTNVVFKFNRDTNYNVTTAPGRYDSRGVAGQYFLEVSNSYIPYVYNTWVTGATNIIAYARGSKADLSGWAGQYYALDNNPSIPLNAVMVVSNTLATPLPLYLNQSLSGSPITLTNGQAMTFTWTGSSWINTGASKTQPPANFHVGGSF